METPMVTELFRIAAALLILLTIAESLAGKRLAFLPLGGNHVAQTGIVLGAAFVIVEVLMVVLHL